MTHCSMPRMLGTTLTSEWLGLNYQSDAVVAQHARLTKLLTALKAEFTVDENQSVLTRGAEAEFFRRELKSYAEWLATMPANPQPKRRGKPADDRAKAFVVALARHWPTLTGEAPTAWRDNYTGQPGGRFYEFLQALWPKRWRDAGMPWVTFPSPTTVERWLNIHNS